MHLNNRLLDELGHDIKNKLSVIGTTLGDLSSGIKVDNDSLEDTKVVFNHLLNLANILSQSSILLKTQSSDQLSNLGHYLICIMQLILENPTNTEINTEREELTLVIKIKELSFNKTIRCPNLVNNKTSRLTFIRKASNSSELVYQLLLQEQIKKRIGEPIDIQILNQITNSVVDSIRF